MIHNFRLLSRNRVQSNTNLFSYANFLKKNMPFVAQLPPPLCIFFDLKQAKKTFYHLKFSLLTG